MNFSRLLRGFGPIRDQNSIPQDPTGPSDVLSSRKNNKSADREGSTNSDDNADNGDDDDYLAGAPYLSMMLQGEAHMAAEQESTSTEATPSTGDGQVPTKDKLAQRIMEIFDLNEREPVLAEYPCWLLQTVLLSGHMYITSKHLCFYAYMPKHSVSFTNGKGITI